MVVLIRDELINPPTWFTSFRDLTLVISVFWQKSVVIESDNPDPYYYYLKDKGGMDFISDFVGMGKEQGIRIDFEPRFSPTIVTDRIVPENFYNILASLKIQLPN